MAGSEHTQGELPWRTEFGSLVHLLRHQKNDAVLQELARVHVDALKRWEPRVQVTSVRVTRDRLDGENVLSIRLRYNILDWPAGTVLVAGAEQSVATRVPDAVTWRICKRLTPPEEVLTTHRKHPTWCGS